MQVVSTSDCRDRRSIDSTTRRGSRHRRWAHRHRHGAGAAIWDPLSGAARDMDTDETSTVRAVAFGDGDRLGATSDSGRPLRLGASVPGRRHVSSRSSPSDVEGGKLRFSTDLNAWSWGPYMGTSRRRVRRKFTVGASATSLPMATVHGQRHGRPRSGHRRHSDRRRTVDEARPHRHVGPPRDAAARWPRVRRRDGSIGSVSFRPGPSSPEGLGVWQLDGVTVRVLGHRATDPVTAIAPGANGWAIGLSTGEVLRTAGPVEASRRSPRWRARRGIAMLDSGGVAIADGQGAVTVVDPSGASTAVPLDRPIRSLASRGDWLLQVRTTGRSTWSTRPGRRERWPGGEGARRRGRRPRGEPGRHEDSSAAATIDHRVWTIASDGGLERAMTCSATPIGSTRCPSARTATGSHRPARTSASSSGAWTPASVSATRSRSFGSPCSRSAARGTASSSSPTISRACGAGTCDPRHG